MKRFVYSLLILVLATNAVMAQPADRRITKQEYIDQYKDDAVREMLESGVPASITMAQGMLESDYGNSPLARYANNHFGIKCHTSWKGATFFQDDDEENECFRRYYSAKESFHDHSEFLNTRSRYNFLFDLKITDYKGWCRGLKKAGYATNPRYPELLIKIIEDNKLYELDQVKKMPEKPRKRPEVKEQPAPAMPAPEMAVHENGIKYVRARAGDTPYKLARRNGKGLWEITMYNDMSKDSPIKEGDIIYLQPKRKNAKQDFHMVKAGETMHDISQQYGVKLKHLYKKNNMARGTQPKEGQKLVLNSRAKKK